MTPQEVQQLCQSLDSEPVTSIRLNDKLDYLTFECDTDEVPWHEDGYYLSERPQFTLDPLLHAGCYYVQEASSMFVGEVLNQYLKKDSIVLDLCAAPGGKSTLIKRILQVNGFMQDGFSVVENAEIDDLGRLGPVEEFSGRLRILDAPTLAGNAGHHMGIEDHTHLLNPGNLGIGLLQVMVLAHEFQHIIQAALNAQVQPPDTGVIELLQLFVGFFRQVGHRGIHVHRGATGEIMADPLQDPQQMVGFQTESIAVPQKNGLGIASGSADPLHLRLHLLLGQLPVGKVLEQSAEGTGIVGTAHRNREHIAGALHGRPADLAFVLHRNFPLFLL